MFEFLRRLKNAVQHEFAVIFAVSAYENNRKATKSSFGNWESLINPAQLMLFYIGMRLGFSFLRGNNRLAAGGSTEMYFNVIVFITTGFSLAFLFRNIFEIF